MPTQNEIEQGRALRLQAMELLKQARELDGLIPQLVAHDHQYGSTLYLGHFHEIPDDEVASKILEEEFEPHKGESLTVADVSLEELTGLDNARAILAPASEKLRM